MPKPALLAALLAALGVGWLIGSLATSQGRGSMPDDEAFALREENARLKLALGERGASLRPGAALGGHGAEPDELLPPPPISPDGAETFDVAKFTNADRAFQVFLAYIATMLDKGPAGHLELLATISATVFDSRGSKQTMQLVGGEERAARFKYPLLRFAMNREGQVADLTETVFKTMAREPQKLAALDHDLLQLFTDDVAIMLPGIVGPTRMERFRTYAREVLAAPLEQQPGSVQRVRRDIQQAMASWSPPLSPEEALARLQQGGLSPEESLALLQRLEPGALARIDIDCLVGPLLERDPWQVISFLAQAKLDDGTRGRLDGRIIQGAVQGSLNQAVLNYWLRHTARTGFPEAREFIERGLQQSAREAAGAFLLTALGLQPAPPADWIAWAEERYEFTEEVRVVLLKRRGGK
ncbi:MAG: hypothetical protein O2894_03635 [Planctomycetota bacterium]|nr:hypothetical protein [Planctomycetota bacterium]